VLASLLSAGRIFVSTVFVLGWVWFSLAWSPLTHQKATLNVLSLLFYVFSYILYLFNFFSFQIEFISRKEMKLFCSKVVTFVTIERRSDRQTLLFRLGF
jgi:hypothetical protein